MVTRLDHPLTLPCGAVLKNRLAKAAMTEGLASAENRTTPDHARLYERWAKGGYGLLLTGNVVIDRRFLERPGNVVIDRNGGHDELAVYAKAGSQDDTHIWMQINHPGRQAGTGTETFVSASENDLIGQEGVCRAMEPDEIEDLIERFILCARVAQDTGFTGVQIHAAHGYLLSQFLSPLTNRRQDAWGGALENRARPLLEILRRTRVALGPDFPISVKLNSADFQTGGFQEEESLQVIRWLQDDGLDLLEISGGNYESMRMSGRDESMALLDADDNSSTTKREAYFLDFAARIRPHIRVPLMVTGGFRARTVMEKALGSGETDVIGLARPLCYDPEAGHRLLSGELERLTSPAEDFSLAPEQMEGLSEIEVSLMEVGVAGAYHFNQLRRLAAGLEAEAKIDGPDQIERNQKLEAETQARYASSWPPPEEDA
ncbi:MAG: NADH:flavin oxidoreductase/NADH oxidase family protein [Myxococcota bacterium]|nr:NADH:flavin oxidoreductase/NADH oxidase family protein [Myxococcota bacterium]